MECDEALGCSARCGTPAQDPTPGKLHYQNCTLKCSVPAARCSNLGTAAPDFARLSATAAWRIQYSHEDAVFDDAMTCLNSHDCMHIPSINDPKTDPWFNRCLPNDQIRPAKVLNESALTGGWWAAIGFHPIYDCSFA